MRTLTLAGVRISGVTACLPPRMVDNLVVCRALFADEAKAVNVVATTGIRARRIVEPGVTSLDLCCAAAERLLAGRDRTAIGAVLCVTFTPARQMPCNACQAQARLGLAKDVIAYDIGLACSGYLYGLHAAGLLARELGAPVLLLDGDVQTPRVDPQDAATVPVLADAGTATLVEPADGDDPWRFAFLSDGAQGEALTLPPQGSLHMDGFGVFRFVATDVLKFIKEFLAATAPAAIDAFVPHQANVYMVRQLAKSLGLASECVWISGDEAGNSASATVPVTLAWNGRLAAGTGGRFLLAGFGGGLSAAAGLVTLAPDVQLDCFDYGEARA